ncbi:MAG: hypothetical protein KIT84_42435 [Labilithrix sp.]|nr:hypothetical protein [Labilithrix sp.]MCW5817735.1 hypothetical protein [Labilithrix sp.]
MDCRGLVVLSAVLIAGSIPLLPACKGPDPGAITFEERPGGGTTDPPGSSSSTSGSSASSGAGGLPDGETFFKTPFEHTPAVPSANSHNDGTHSGQIPLQGDGANPPKNCVVAGCHEGGAQPWAGAGSVFADAAGAAFPKGAKMELMILGPDGNVFSRTSPDEDGNFWFEEGNGVIPDNSTVAIRKEGGVSKPMITPLTAANKGAGCNNATGCHGAAGLRIYAP